MRDFRIYIPSLGAASKTIEGLPDFVPVTVVLPEDAPVAGIRTYMDAGCDVIFQPSDIKDIAHKREWICTVAPEEHILMIDDDLSVAVFDPTHGGHRSVSVDNLDLVERFWTETWPNEILANFAAYGLGCRFMAQKGGIKRNQHLGLAWGFNKSLRRRLKWRRVVCYEDIDCTLQCLTSGIPIGLHFDMVVNHPAYNAAIDWRESGDVDHDLIMMLDLWPEYIKEKPLNPGAHPQSRTRIAWQKAAKAGGLK